MYIKIDNYNCDKDINKLQKLAAKICRQFFNLIN